MFYRHALEYMQSPRSEKTGIESFPTEPTDHFWTFLWPVVGGDTFSPLAPILGTVKKMAMSPSFSVRGGEYDTKIMCNIRLDGASDICEGDNFRRLVSTKRPKHEKKDRPFPSGLKQLEIRLH